MYFVHSYRAVPEKANEDWVLATCDYGGEFIAAVQKGEVTACQFHPEKSGEKGIGIFKNFLEGNANAREAAGDGARSRSKSDRVATDLEGRRRVVPQRTHGRASRAGFEKAPRFASADSRAPPPGLESTMEAISLRPGGAGVSLRPGGAGAAAPCCVTIFRRSPRHRGFLSDWLRKDRCAIHPRQRCRRPPAHHLCMRVI